MSSEISYDPVSAVDESDATGAVAETFRDIRQTMNIPIVTSIWRGLAGMDNGLEKVWLLAKPIYQNANPGAKLNEIISNINLTLPEDLTEAEIINTGLSKKDWENILIILNAYNKSNGMNMVVLHAMIKHSFPKIYSVKKQKEIKPKKILKLLKKSEISIKTWNFVREVNSISAANGLDSHVATLWRHLAHWPIFLKLIYEKLSPLNNKNIIQLSMASTTKQLNENGLDLSYQKTLENNLSETVYSTVKNYVYEETQVIRMVVIGHIIEKWINTQKFISIS